MTDDVKLVEEPSLDPMTVKLDDSLSVEHSVPSRKGVNPSLKARLWSLIARAKDSDNDAHIDAVPIRVLIGFLPDVSKRDALEYSQGLAEKYFEKITLAYFKVYPMDNGWAYEAHEGGSGRAYLPAILERFEAHGAFIGRVESSVIIKTATRYVEVTRSKEGLTSIFLPESVQVSPTPGIVPSEKMEPAFDRRTGFLLAGSILFVTGCAAFFSAMLIGRYHDHIIEKQTPYVVDYAKLPISKWNDLQVAASKGKVTKFSFNSNLKTWDAIATEEFKAPSLPLSEGTTPPVNKSNGSQNLTSPSPPSETLNRPKANLGSNSSSANSFKIPAPSSAPAPVPANK